MFNLNKHNYIVVKERRDRSDGCLFLNHYQYMNDQGTYTVKNSLGAVASVLYDAVKTYVVPGYSADKLRRAFSESGVYSLRLKPLYARNGDSSLFLMVDTKKHQYGVEMNGRERFKLVCKVYSIYDSDAVYLVSEQITGCSKNWDMIERCYTRYFYSLSDAKEYQAAEQSESFHIFNGVKSRFKIMVYDRNDLDSSLWYNMNLEIASLAQKITDDDERQGFYDTGFLYPVLDDALGEAYRLTFETFDDEKRMRIFSEVYDSIRDYLPEEFLLEDDEQYESISDPIDMSDFISFVIRQALGSAESREDFEAVKKSLGKNRYFITFLNASVYFKDPDNGYILVDKIGNIELYPDIDCITEMDSAESVVYKGRFMPNRDAVLPCYEKYRPGLICEEILDYDMYLDLSSMYIHKKCVEFQQHNELKIVKDSTGMFKLAVGNLFPKGIRPDEFEGSHPPMIKNVVFPAKYNTYELNKEECCQLLNGNTLKVENYVSKSGEKFTVYLKLRMRDDTDVGYPDEVNYLVDNPKINRNAIEMLNQRYGVTAAMNKQQ